MTDYLLRNIPSDLWRQVKSQAALEGISARDLILDALRERTNAKEDVMKLTNAQSQTLQALASGTSNKPNLKSAWNKRTIAALEDRGFVTVRDVDGAIRVTPAGVKYIFEHHPSPDLEK